MTSYNAKRNTIITTYMCILMGLFGLSLWTKLPTAMLVGSLAVPKALVLIGIPLLMAGLNVVVNKSNDAPREDMTENQVLARGAITWLVPYVTIISMALILFVNFEGGLPATNLIVLACVAVFTMATSAYCDTKEAVEIAKDKGKLKTLVVMTTVVKFLLSTFAILALYIMFFTA